MTRASGLLARMHAAADTPEPIAPTEEQRRAPSTALAVVAAVLPLAFVALACPLTALALPNAGASQLQWAIEEAGITAYAVFAITLLVAFPGVAVVLGLAVKGRRVPIAIGVGFASLPWLLGLLGAMWGMSIAEAAVRNADAATMATMMARGIAEATNNRFFGASLSSALFAALGLGLGIGALAQRAPRRSLLGAAIAAGATLPLVAVAGLGLSSMRPASGLELVLAALAGLIAAALGGLGTGADTPHARSGALGAAAPIASGLAVCAAITVAASSATMEVLRAVSSIEASSRPAILARAATEMEPILLARTAAFPLALLASLAAAAWAATRARPSAGRIVGAIAVLLLAGVVVLADALVYAHGGEVLDELTAPPWSDVDDLRVARVPHAEEWAEDAAGIVRPEGLARLDGTIVAPFDASLGAALVTLKTELEQRHSAFEGEEETPEWLREEPGDEGSPRWIGGGEYEPPPPNPLERDSDVTLAIDARVSGASLRRLIDAASERSMYAITFTGRGEGATDEQIVRVREAFAMAAPLMEVRGSVRVVLGPGVPAEVSSADPRRLHGTIGAQPLEHVRTRPGAFGRPARQRSLLSDDEPASVRAEPRAVYLAIADDATAQSVMTTVARAAARGLTPVLVSGALP